MIRAGLASLVGHLLGVEPGGTIEVRGGRRIRQWRAALSRALHDLGPGVETPVLVPPSRRLGLSLSELRVGVVGGTAQVSLDVTTLRRARSDADTVMMNAIGSFDSSRVFPPAAGQGGRWILDHFAPPPVSGARTPRHRQMLDRAARTELWRMVPAPRIVATASPLLALVEEIAGVPPSRLVLGARIGAGGGPRQMCTLAVFIDDQRQPSVVIDIGDTADARKLLDNASEMAALLNAQKLSSATVARCDVRRWRGRSVEASDPRATVAGASEVALGEAHLALLNELFAALGERRPLAETPFFQRIGARVYRSGAAHSTTRATVSRLQRAAAGAMVPVGFCHRAFEAESATLGSDGRVVLSRLHDARQGWPIHVDVVHYLRRQAERAGVHDALGAAERSLADRQRGLLRRLPSTDLSPRDLVALYALDRAVSLTSMGASPAEPRVAILERWLQRYLDR